MCFCQYPFHSREAGCIAAAGHGSVYRPRGLRVLQLLHGFEDSYPNRIAVQIGLFEQGISPHRCFNARVLTVLVDEQFGSAVDVEVINHSTIVLRHAAIPRGWSARR